MSFLIDTHAHLTDDKLKNDINAIIENCKKENVHKIVSIGCSLEDAANSIKLAQKYPQIIYATAGIYPHDNAEGSEKALTLAERLEKLATIVTDKHVVAVGECGLDYTVPPPYEKIRTKEEQHFLFQSQLKLAHEIMKPLIIHSREATEDTLLAYKNSQRPKAAWHCFTENYEIAKKALDLGLMLSFTGIVTYPSAKELRETILKIPLDRIMLETDSPYLVPQNARKNGVKVNNPAYVKIVAQEISIIKGVRLEKVIESTYQNALIFFGF